MDVIWFRPPTDEADGPDGAGTLNACYNALDVHVIAGRADDIAIVDGERELSFARVLTEVAAFAGVLQALGVSPGAEVVVLDVPPLEDVVARLACARLGAVHFRTPSPSPALMVVSTLGSHDSGPVPLITVDDTGELDWSTMMRAGRSEPAGCAELAGDAIIHVVDGRPVRTAEHLLAVAGGDPADPGHDDPGNDDPVLASLLAGRTLVLAGRA